VFEVSATDDELLTFSARPDSGNTFIESLRTVDSEGTVIYERYADDPADGIALIVTGASTVIVDASGEYTASVEPTPVQELATGDSTTASDSAVFEVTVGDGDAFVVAARPDSEADYVANAVVIDPNGTALGDVVFDESGAVTIEITDASAGTHRVFVDGYGDYTVSLTEN
jgi:hypothetical protein